MWALGPVSPKGPMGPGGQRDQWAQGVGCAHAHLPACLPARDPLGDQTDGRNFRNFGFQIFGFYMILYGFYMILYDFYVILYGFYMILYDFYMIYIVFI